MVCQRDSTSAPLAQRLDATRKGVSLASIPLICSHAAFNLPVRDIFGQVTGAMKLGKSQGLRDRVLDLARVQ